MDQGASKERRNARKGRMLFPDKAVLPYCGNNQRGIGTADRFMGVSSRFGNALGCRTEKVRFAREDRI